MIPADDIEVMNELRTLASVINRRKENLVDDFITDNCKIVSKAVAVFNVNEHSEPVRWLDECTLDLGVSFVRRAYLMGFEDGSRAGSALIGGIIND